VTLRQNAPPANLHHMPAEAVVAALGSDGARGLARAEAARRLALQGPNRLKSAPETPWWRRLLEQFESFLVIVLLAATVISVVEWLLQSPRESALPYEAIVILAIVVLNALLGYFQEARAERSVRALMALAAPESTVIREGERQRIAAEAIVPGDILLVEAGDRIPADARLVEAANLQADEASAKANYSLGVVLASSGEMNQAIQRLTAAVKYNPNYAEALMALGDTLRRSGRIEASLKPYADVVRINPRSAEARFAYALALVRLRRYRDAKAWLEESARVLPDRPELSYALARILAAAPDDTVRDGARALALVQELMKGNQTTVVGETMAMALAELGQFSDTIDVQKGVIAASQQAGAAQDVRRMTANLHLYERRQACRMPWADDDPVHIPAMFASAAPAGPTAR